jgi:hypothetical protein
MRFRFKVLRELLNRAAAAIETPGDLSDQDRLHLSEDLLVEAEKWEDKPFTYHAHFSERGHALVWAKTPLDIPILTVENYLKWYELYLIQPDGSITTIPFEELEPYEKDDGPVMGDHVFNPRVVQRMAHAQDYHLDTQAFEMLIGRWELEYKNKSEYQQEME